MKRVFLFQLVCASALLAQPVITKGLFLSGPNVAENLSSAPVQGAPYSATMVNESVQTLADGNRIVQSTTGTIARDSQGRTRQDMPLPTIANMSAANAPHMVLLRDPVAQTVYTLNLTDKTAHKMPAMPPPPNGAGAAVSITATKQVSGGAMAVASGIAPALPGLATQVWVDNALPQDASTAKTENLGSQTMEGVMVQGVRTTRTIAAGEVGNDQPINIVTEVWTSPDLKTVVYSKRSDPRIGDQTFQLTNIVRAEPDASLFTVPSDFKVTDGPESGNVIFYRPKP